MAIINTTDELKEVLPVSGNLTFEDILPFCTDAELKYIKPALGTALYNSIVAKIAANTITGAEVQLLDYARKCVGAMALFAYIPIGQLIISSSGITQLSTDTNKAAFKYQIEALQQSVFGSGFTALDALFAYLEENKATFTTWVDSTGYTLFYENYISTASNYSEFVPILGESRSIFIKLKGAMVDAEETVAKLISTDQDVALRTLIKANNLGAVKTKGVRYIRKYVAFKSMADALPLLAVKLDERGLLAFDSTGSGDSANYSKTVGNDVVGALVLKFMAKANEAENDLMLHLNANLDVYTDYAASITTDVVTVTDDTSSADRVISFL